MFCNGIINYLFYQFVNAALGRIDKKYIELGVKVIAVGIMRLDEKNNHSFTKHTEIINNNS